MNWRNAACGRGSDFDVIIKIVSLFLIGMGVLAMFGKLRLPSIEASKTILGLNKPKKCSSCGRHIIGKGPCPCKKG